MSDAVEKEIEAIRAVLGALEPLSEPARQSVLGYVTKRLGIAPSEAPPAPPPRPAAPPIPAPAPGIPPVAVHIEALKNEKKPRSANEMAALVAYYLSHLVPPEQRKATINTQDLETYFKIAKFPLPGQIRVTLQNAKNSGYFDTAGDGGYKLNAVGYNLVVHSMPRGHVKATGSHPKRSKKRTK